MSVSGPSVRPLEGFDDPAFTSDRWSDLLHRGDTDVVFLTYGWQRAWWDVYGRGRLLLLIVETDGQPIVLAPMFSDAGMVFFVGSGGSDYLDFIGDSSDPEVLPALLDAARAAAPGFVGFRFYHVPDASRTGARLRDAAERLGLACFDEGTLPAPVLDLRNQAAAQAAPNKKSLRRHENGMRGRGTLTVHHLRDGEAIRPHLPTFFDQHVARWACTVHPSLFLGHRHRAFYERLTETAGDGGWLRFTRLDLDGRPVAFHFGSCYGGTFLWYKPSFDVELARHSPGEVLLRHLLLAAKDEGAHTFDFGLGDEPFKQRFATRNPLVRTWGLYPTEVR